MPVKIPATDTAALNMTPMIDIVFNLVTFFMLTLDMSQKDLAVLDLPRANGGIEDKPPETQPGKKEDNTRFTINIEPKGSIWFKGERWYLSDEDPKKQDQALENLRQALRTLTRPAKLRDEKGFSKVMVLIRGDRSAKWKYVQWIMQVCADPNIKIYKMHFAVEHKPKE